MDRFQQSEQIKGEEENEGTAMSMIRNYRGLCSTCKNTSTCTYPRDPDRPIFYCCEHEGYEECEGSVSLALLRPGNIFSQKPDFVAKPLTMEPATGVDKGLCRNCTNRETCTFPKPEGGVWHCDEYR